MTGRELLNKLQAQSDHALDAYDISIAVGSSEYDDIDFIPLRELCFTNDDGHRDIDNMANGTLDSGSPVLLTANF